MARHRLVRPRRIALGIAACALALAGGMPAWAEDLETWVAAEVRGPATQRGADGAWQPVAPGAIVAAGASLRTGDGATLVLFHGGDRITVSPNSELQIPVADAVDGPSILERLGTLLFKVEHSPGRRFEVQAPYLAAVVKGTVFTVSTSEGASSVHLAEGVVEVTAAASKESALLHPGETAVVPASGKDMSILGRVGSASERRSENDPARHAGKSGAVVITRTLGEEDVDIGAVSKGLLGGSTHPHAPLAVSAGSHDAAGNTSAAADSGGGTDASSDAPSSAAATMTVDAPPGSAATLGVNPNANANLAEQATNRSVHSGANPGHGHNKP